MFNNHFENKAKKKFNLWKLWSRLCIFKKNIYIRPKKKSENYNFFFFLLKLCYCSF